MGTEVSQFREDLGMDKPRQRKVIRIPFPRHPVPEEDGKFAPFYGRHVCLSPSGRWRARHDYCVESRAGTRCLFCGVLRSWEPW